MNWRFLKVEKGKFNFCRLDLEQKKDRIVVSIEDYAEAIVEAKIPKKVRRNKN